MQNALESINADHIEMGMVIKSPERVTIMDSDLAFKVLEVEGDRAGFLLDPTQDVPDVRFISRRT